MLQSKWVKAVMIAGCIAAFSGGAVYAENAADTPVSHQVVRPDLPQAVLDLQAEVDNFLFVEHNAKLAELGITVTHTSPTADGYVEIGITPYREADAAYLIEQLGADRVRVIEGTKAVTFKPEPVYEAMPMPEQAPDAVAATTVAEGAEMQALSATADDIAATAAPADTRALPAFVYAGIAAAAALAGLTALMFRRLALRRR
jgi:hypothetical protein